MSYLHASSAEQSVMLTLLPKKPFLSKLSCKIKASFQVVFSKNLILTSACTVPWESGLSLDRLKDTRSCCLLIQYDIYTTEHRKVLTKFWQDKTTGSRKKFLYNNPFLSELIINENFQLQEIRIYRDITLVFYC